MGKKNKIHIGLIRDNAVTTSGTVKDLFKDVCDSVTIKNGTDTVGTLYTDKSKEQFPTWIENFFQEESYKLSNASLFSANVKAVLHIEINNQGNIHHILIFFGNGRHLLKNDSLEERFGLKVILNIIDPESLRSLDKTALGSASKRSREQVSKEGHLHEFGVDIEQDLLNSITASIDKKFLDEVKTKTKINLSKTVSGRDTIMLSGDINIGNIKSILPLIISKFLEETIEYFEWVNNVKEIRSKNREDELKNELIKKIEKKNYSNISLVPPSIIEWSDVKCFRYVKKKSKDIDSLDARSLFELFSKDRNEIEEVFKKNIITISSSMDCINNKWNIYKCIYTEISINDSIYILSAGKWYEIKPSFIEKIDEDITRIYNDNTDYIPYNCQNYDNEQDYNEALAKHLGNAHCLDAKNIIHGGGHSRIEFCDIYTDNKMIHVKRFTSSAQMSHLFSQGRVSAELLLNDSEFRQKVLDGLKKLNAPTSLSKSKPNPRDYKIVFAIIGKEIKKLPLFSKITLRNTYNQLSNYGFTVLTKTIPIQSNTP
ncbi:TIGR04141 family sporadically distributed protein [Acetobacteraceae bacterium B3987]|nr:TIGR04141 family sporadically distributed protein [Acetobacteraceae bacterium B3987]